MADIFISFKTDDTPRVQAIHDGFRARGLTVFWSNDIPKGAPDYQAIIKDELLKAPVVVVVWTNGSVHSGPVVQECSQAEKANKLFQILLDDIEPIDMPMEVKYKSQKTLLFGWSGDRRHPEWTMLNNAIDTRLGGGAPTARQELAPSGAIVVDVSPNGRSKTRAFVPGNGRTEWFTDHPQGPEMVVVPAGSFMMGSPENEPECASDESPQRRVTIASAFAVARHAITRAQFAAFIDNKGYKSEGGAHVNTGENWVLDAKRSWRNTGLAQDGSHPVVCINWGEAKAYAAWLTEQTGKFYRLLTDAEREYVARAGTTTPFWWGSSITPTQANYDGNYSYAGGGTKGEYRKSTVPVGSFAANPWGLFNVHGNVWEWCEDIWHKNHNDAPSDGSPWLQGGDASRRVLRGGSWNSNPGFLRAAFRVSYDPTVRDSIKGFRVARTLTP